MLESHAEECFNEFAAIQAAEATQLLHPPPPPPSPPIARPAPAKSSFRAAGINRPAPVPIPSKGPTMAQKDQPGSRDKLLADLGFSPPRALANNNTAANKNHDNKGKGRAIDVDEDEDDCFAGGDDEEYPFDDWPEDEDGNDEGGHEGAEGEEEEEEEWERHVPAARTTTTTPGAWSERNTTTGGMRKDGNNSSPPKGSIYISTLPRVLNVACAFYHPLNSCFVILTKGTVTDEHLYAPKIARNPLPADEPQKMTAKKVWGSTRGGRGARGGRGGKRGGVKRGWKRK